MQWESATPVGFPVVLVIVLPFCRLDDYKLLLCFANCFTVSGEGGGDLIKKQTKCKPEVMHSKVRH